MDRRLFLKTGGLVAGGMILSSCATFRGANNQIQLAAIGCGRMGTGDIQGLLAVADQYNAIFVAVCDVDSNRTADAKKLLEEHYAQKGKTHKIHTYSDYKKMVKKSWIDAVTISTPDHNHGLLAIAAAEAKKDIYLQKPLTYTIAEGQQLVEVVRRNNVILQTGSQQRSSIYFRRVCELVRNQKIGELEKIEVRVPMDKGRADFATMPVPSNLDYDRWLEGAPFVPYTEVGVHPQHDLSRPGWMQRTDYCHGMITNWGAHMFDIAQWGSGNEYTAPVEIEASAQFEDRGIFNVHRGFKAYNRYSNGVIIDFQTVSPGENIGPGVKFVGSNGWARCTRGGFKAHDREMLRWEAGEKDVKLRVSKNHYGNFLESIRSRKDPIAHVDIGHHSNTLCVVNLIAAKVGKPLKWNPKAEKFENNAFANELLLDMRKA